MQIVSGGATTLTKNYPTGVGTHLPQPIKVGTTLSYLATVGMDTVSAAVDSAGTVAAQQLYLAYGGSRYTSGTMPTSKGYTGQRADAATGLDYYGARYYDPVVGQFTSADDVLPGDGLDPWGLSRYAYVEGNPISRNDPTGHDWFGSALSVAGAVLDAATGFSSMVNDVKTVFSPSASPLDKVLAVGDLALNVAMDVSMVAGVGEGARAAYVAGKVVAKVAVEVAGKMAAHAVADVAEHAAEDVAAHAAEDIGENALKVATNGGEGSGPMKLLRTIQKGEKLSDIMDEVKQGMYLTGNEHAVVTLANGERALVSGGRYGIEFGADSIKRILFHTHPWDDLALGPSDADKYALEQLGQASSHVYEHGVWHKFFNPAWFR